VVVKHGCLGTIPEYACDFNHDSFRPQSHGLNNGFHPAEVKSSKCVRFPQGDIYLTEYSSCRENAFRRKLVGLARSPVLAAIWGQAPKTQTGQA